MCYFLCLRVLIDNLKLVKQELLNLKIKKLQLQPIEQIYTTFFNEFNFTEYILKTYLQSTESKKTSINTLRQALENGTFKNLNLSSRAARLFENKTNKEIRTFFQGEVLQGWYKNCINTI